MIKLVFMRQNLFQLYLDTSGFTQLPRKGVRGFLEGLGTVITGNPRPRHEVEHPEGSVKVFQSDEGFRMEEYNAAGQLVGRQWLDFHCSPNTLKIQTVDPVKELQSSVDHYELMATPSGQAMQHVSHREGDTLVKYQWTPDWSERVPQVETKMRPGTEQAEQETYFDQAGNKTYYARMDASNNPIVKEFYHDGTETLHIVQHFKDGKETTRLDYRPDGSLHHKSTQEGENYTLHTYKEDGTTLESSTQRKGDIPVVELLYHEAGEDENQLPHTKRLYNDGKRYKEIHFDREGKTNGETTFNPETDQRTHGWHRHSETGDHFDYRYNEKNGNLISEERRRPEFSGEGGLMDQTGRIGPLTERIEYHGDGLTPRLTTEFNDEEKPTRAFGQYPNGDTKSQLRYDTDGKLETKTMVAAKGERMVYEASFDAGRKGTEILHFSPDPDIVQIERDFYPKSGRVSKEVVSYKNSDKAEVDYYDQKPQTVAQEVLTDSADNIKVRRFYDKEGKRKPSAHDIEPDSSWQNRHEVAKSKRVWGKPSDVLLTEVSTGLRLDGYESILDGKVSLLLQGDKEHLLNAQRKIEKVIPGARVTLEKREQFGDQTGDYFGGGATWVSFKKEHMMYGYPRKKVDVLKVELPYDQDQQWPKSHYALGGYAGRPEFDKAAEEAKKKLVELTARVHSYIHCDLGLIAKPMVSKIVSTYTTGVELEPRIPGSSAMDPLRKEVVIAVVGDQLRKHFQHVSTYGVDGVRIYNSHTPASEGQQKAEERAQEILGKVSNMFKVSSENQGQSAAR